MRNNKLLPALHSPILKFFAAFLLLIVLGITQLKAQHQKPATIVFNSKHIESGGRKLQFSYYKGYETMRIFPSPTRQTISVSLKDITFTNGTIEFDAIPAEDDFNDQIAINFHQQDIYNYESVYLRLQDDEDLQRDDAIQYTPFIHGVNLWDMMKPFRGFASIKNNEWNHIKLVISGFQMMVYVNDMKTHVLKVPRLEGNFNTGSISLDGNAYFANLIIQPNATENLSPQEGLDWTDNDPSYLRKWTATKPKPIATDRELSSDDFPNDTAQWIPIVAERRGLVNLIRLFKGTELTSYPKDRRYVWLKTTIRSLKQQQVGMQLGFNKEVYVFVNKRLLYVDKNSAGEHYQKYPGGLIDIANTSFQLPLKKGDNEILIGIACKDYGWGIIARIVSLDDLFIER